MIMQMLTGPTIDHIIEREGYGIAIGYRSCVDTRTSLDTSITIGDDVMVGQGVKIGAHSDIQDGSVLCDEVTVGPHVTIFPSVLIMAGASICPDEVTQHSTNARELYNGVSIGPGVFLHNEVALDSGAIVPTQRTIIHIGNLGSKNRVITIYGAEEGPLFSVGCQIGVPHGVLKSNVATSAHTSHESAQTYAPYLNTFQELGSVVQRAYDGEKALIDEIIAMRQELGLESPLDPTVD